MSDLSLNVELGPQFTLEVNDESEFMFTLEAGVKSSSLFSAALSTSPTVDVEITSTEALGAYRAVTVTGLYCQQTGTSMSLYAGVTKQAYSLGETIKVVRSGIMTEGAWTWTPDLPIFIGVNGVLTQTPSAVPIRRIGWAISATQIHLDPFPIIGA